MTESIYEFQFPDCDRLPSFPFTRDSERSFKSTGKMLLGPSSLSQRSSQLPVTKLERFNTRSPGPPGCQQHDASDGQYNMNLEGLDESSDPSSEDPDSTDIGYHAPFASVDAPGEWTRRLLRSGYRYFLDPIMDLDSDSDSGLDRKSRKYKQSKVKKIKK